MSAATIAMGDHNDAHLGIETLPPGEKKIMDMFDETHIPGNSSTEVDDIVANTINKAQQTSRASVEKLAKKQAPSKMMMKMKERGHSMTAPLTQPVKDVMNKIRSRTMGLVGRMRAGEHLSWKEFMAIVAIIPGASIIIGAHYANMFSQKAQAAIESGKRKWEGFLHSLGLGDDATVADIAHAESAHASAPTHPESPHMKTLETVPTAANDDHHEVTSDAPHVEETHRHAA